MTKVTPSVLKWPILMLLLAMVVVAGGSSTAAKESITDERRPNVVVEKMTETEVRLFLREQGLSEEEIEQRLITDSTEVLPTAGPSSKNNLTEELAAYYLHNRGFNQSCGYRAAVVSYLAPGYAYMGVTNFNNALVYWSGWFTSSGGYYRLTVPGGSYKMGQGVSNAYPYVSGTGCL